MADFRIDIARKKLVKKYTAITEASTIDLKGAISGYVEGSIKITNSSGASQSLTFPAGGLLPHHLSKVVSIEDGKVLEVFFSTGFGKVWWAYNKLSAVTNGFSPSDVISEGLAESTDGWGHDSFGGSTYSIEKQDGIRLTMLTPNTEEFDYLVLMPEFGTMPISLLVKLDAYVHLGTPTGIRLTVSMKTTGNAVHTSTQAMAPGQWANIERTLNPEDEVNEFWITAIREAAPYNFEAGDYFEIRNLTITTEGVTVYTLKLPDQVWTGKRFLETSEDIGLVLDDSVKVNGKSMIVKVKNTDTENPITVNVGEGYITDGFTGAIDIPAGGYLELTVTYDNDSADWHPQAFTQIV